MASNLVFLQNEKTAGTVTSISLSCFGKGYTAYQIVVKNNIGAADGNYVFARFLDSSGSAISDSEYWDAASMLKAAGSFDESWKRENGNLFAPLWDDGDDDGLGGGLVMVVHNPDDSGSYTYANWQSAIYKVGEGLRGVKGIAYHASAEVISGIQIVAYGSNREFDVTVYGVG